MSEYKLSYNIKILGWSFLFVTNCEKVYCDVRNMMSLFFEFETNNDTGICNRINVFVFENVYSIEFIGYTRIVDVTDQYKRLLFIIYELILISFDQTAKRVAVFHGAVLSKEENCIAVMAPTQTGKSSFALNYIENGWAYMSDDYLLYDPETKKCIAFPKPVAIRNPDYLISKSYKYLSAINNEEIEISLILPDNHIAVNDLKSLKAVLFIERKEMPVSYQLQSITCSALFKNMMFGSHIASDITINRSIFQILHMVKGYNLMYNSGTDIFEQLDISNLF